MKMLTNPKDIQAWLNEYKIENYTINSDLSVDIKGDVNLINKKLTLIPVKFNRVVGDFSCSWNRLKTLTNCPKIVGQDFSCSRNQLTSLINAPHTVGGNFNCVRNLITSLEFCPRIVGGQFYAGDNDIRRLEFFPDEVGDEFWLNNNPNLGIYQDIHDFSFIKTEHLRIQAVLNEQQQLNQLLERPVDSPRVAFKL